MAFEYCQNIGGEIMAHREDKEHKMFLLKT